MRELVIEQLTRYAMNYIYHRDKEIGAPKQRSGPLWDRHQDEVSAQAAAFARAFRQELQDIWISDADSIGHVLVASTAEWWYENRRRGTEDDVDRLLERCADQLSALLVFKNLHRDAGSPQQTWWSVLAHRAIEKILYVKVQTDRKNTKVPSASQIPDRKSRTSQIGRIISQHLDSDRLHGYMTILLGAADKFQFQGLGKAINYFAMLCSQWDKEDLYAGITDSLPEAGFGQQEAKLPASLIVPSAEAEFLSRSTGNIHEEDKVIHDLWKVMLTALGRVGAEEMWVLLRLHVIHAQDWNQIAMVVLENHCRILDSDDLPPDIPQEQVDSWYDEIQVMFRNLARATRKCPGTLNAVNLRQRFQRAKSAVVSQI